MQLPDRYWNKVEKRDAALCWEWIGSKTNGYGYIRINGRMVRAHRIAFEAAVGPIGQGLVIDHLCRNRACQNPAHMESVPQGTNVHRGVSFAASNARKEACPKGHRYDPKYNDGARRCAECRLETARTSMRRRRAKRRASPD